MPSLLPLRRKPYGIGVHWTTWTQPVAGEHLPFPEAVAKFDVANFVRQLRDAGAGHVLFTANHQLHWLPCPHPVVDEILPGRTCSRDLIGELIEELSRYDLPLILYYHHGCDGPAQDPAWFPAVGAAAPDRQPFYDNIARITAWMGERYGQGIAAWWFDAGWWIAQRPDAPWKQLQDAAHAGFADRLVCFNPGITSRNPLGEFQDYWPGEAEGVTGRPDGPAAPGGLPWYTFTTFHTLAEGGWGLEPGTRHLPRVPPPAREIADYIRDYADVGGAVTMNLSVFQDGTIWPADLNVLREVKTLLGS